PRPRAIARRARRHRRFDRPRRARGPWLCSGFSWCFSKVERRHAKVRARRGERLYAVTPIAPRRDATMPHAAPPIFERHLARTRRCGRGRDALRRARPPREAAASDRRPGAVLSLRAAPAALRELRLDRGEARDPARS